jgi:hypothetical protein
MRKPQSAVNLLVEETKLNTLQLLRRALPAVAVAGACVVVVVHQVNLALLGKGAVLLI